MSLDPKSAKNISNGAFEFFRTAKLETVQIPTHKDLEGYLVIQTDLRKVLQIRLLNTKDPEKAHIYPITWQRLSTNSTGSPICPKILELGEQGGVPFYISELPNGEPVSQFIHKGKTIPPSVAAKLTYDFLESILKEDPLIYQEYGMNPESLWLVETQKGQAPQIQFGDFTINPSDNAEADNYQLCLDLLKYLSGNPPFDEEFQELSQQLTKGPAQLENFIEQLHCYIESNPQTSEYWTEENQPNSILSVLVPEESDYIEAEAKISEVQVETETSKFTNDANEFAAEDSKGFTSSATNGFTTSNTSEFAKAEQTNQEIHEDITPKDPSSVFDQTIDAEKEQSAPIYQQNFDSVDQHDESPDFNTGSSIKNRLVKPFFTLVTLLAALCALIFCITGGDFSKITSKISGSKTPIETDKKGSFTKPIVSSSPKKTPEQEMVPKTVLAPMPKPTAESPLEKDSTANLPSDLFPSQLNDTSSPSSPAYQPEKVNIPTKPVANPVDILVETAEKARANNDYITAINSELNYLEINPNSNESKNRLEQDIITLINSPYTLDSSEIEVITRAAKISPNSYELLISHYRNSQSLEQEVAALVEYSKTAGPSKLAEAGRRIMSNPSATDSDKSRALQLYIQAADQQDAAAQYYAGEALILGLCGTTNKSQGIIYLSQSVSQGHGSAMDLLGVCYVRGWGVAKDESKAISLFRSAINKGNIAAYFNLGARYAEGDQPDLDLAGRVFEEGATKGNVDCMYAVARCYFAGYGRPQNDEKARNWFIQAAKNGHADAIRWCNNNQISWSH